MLRVDHVVFAVRDLDAAGERFSVEFGLASLPGGVHPRWGTGNRVIPFGSDYLELMSVVDPAAAAATTLGRTLIELTTEGDRWFALCLADDDIDATGVRLGLEVDAGSRVRPDGRTVAWRGAGIEDVRRTPDLPFFISWDVPGEQHPGARRLAHASEASGIAWVEIAGDPAAFEGWTDGADLPVRFVEDGRPGIRAVGLATPHGELVVRQPSSA